MQQLGVDQKVRDTWVDHWLGNHQKDECHFPLKKNTHGRVPKWSLIKTHCFFVVLRETEDPSIGHWALRLLPGFEALEKELKEIEGDGRVSVFEATGALKLGLTTIV